MNYTRNGFGFSFWPHVPEICSYSRLPYILNSETRLSFHYSMLTDAINKCLVLRRLSTVQMKVKNTFVKRYFYLVTILEQNLQEESAMPDGFVRVDNDNCCVSTT